LSLWFETLAFLAPEGQGARHSYMGILNGGVEKEFLSRRLNLLLGFEVRDQVQATNGECEAIGTQVLVGRGFVEFCCCFLSHPQSMKDLSRPPLEWRGR
jgi:hypothetical protein